MPSTMKIKLSESTDKKTIQSILFHPSLINTLPDEDRLALKDAVESELNPEVNYLLVHTDKANIGVIRWEPFNNITIEAHVQILPEYWGTGVTEKIAQQVFTYWKETTHFKTLITFVPEDCKQVQRAIHRFGLEPTGVIPKGIIWNQRQQDLYIFSRDLNT